MAPHFDEHGGDEWICQICGQIKNSRVKSEWRPDITGSKQAGNVCPECLKAHEQTKKTGEELRQYIQYLRRKYAYRPNAT